MRVDEMLNQLEDLDPNNIRSTKLEVQNAPLVAGTPAVFAAAIAATGAAVAAFTAGFGVGQAYAG